MSVGIIASVPNEGAKFVPLPEDLGSCGNEAALDKVVDAICSAFGWGDDADPRVLFKERDLDDADDSIPTFLKALSLGQPPFVRVLFRLLGGKGGFGALLRKQGRGKKTTNYEASRDLSGRRLRHSKAVDRIKEWMLNKKREDDLVKALTGEGPELPKPVPEHESLDPEFVERLKRTSSAQPALVRAGLKKLDREATAASVDGSGTKRARVVPGGENWLSGLDALGTLSSPSSEPEADDGAGGGSVASASAASASAASASAASASAASASAASASASAASAGAEGAPFSVKCPKGHACLRMTENPDEPGYDEPACCDHCDQEDLPGLCPYFYHCTVCEYDACPTCAEQPGGAAASSSSSAAAAAAALCPAACDAESSSVEEFEEPSSAAAVAAPAAAAPVSSGSSSAAAEPAAAAPVSDSASSAAAAAASSGPSSSAASAGSSSAAAAAPVDDGRAISPKDLAEFASAQQLLAEVPAEVLKRSLQKLGLKCGGKPEDRAARLFLLKTTKLGALPKAHFATK